MPAGGKWISGGSWISEAAGGLPCSLPTVLQLFAGTTSGVAYGSRPSPSPPNPKNGVEPTVLPKSKVSIKRVEVDTLSGSVFGVFHSEREP
jgi:hypothetical protein